MAKKKINLPKKECDFSEHPDMLARQLTRMITSFFQYREWYNEGKGASVPFPKKYAHHIKIIKDEVEKSQDEITGSAIASIIRDILYKLYSQKINDRDEEKLWLIDQERMVKTLCEHIGLPFDDRAKKVIKTKARIAEAIGSSKGGPAQWAIYEAGNFFMNAGTYRPMMALIGQLQELLETSFNTAKDYESSPVMDKMAYGYFSIYLNQDFLDVPRALSTLGAEDM